MSAYLTSVPPPSAPCYRGLVAITERYFALNYFDHNLSGAQADQDVLKDLMREKLPRLHRHFAHLNVDILSITLNWFLALFFDAVPFLVRTHFYYSVIFTSTGLSFFTRFSIPAPSFHRSIALHLKKCAYQYKILCFRPLL